MWDLEEISPQLLRHYREIFIPLLFLRNIILFFIKIRGP